MGKYYTFRDQSPENRLCCIFQTRGNIVLQRCSAIMTKHRQQSTKVGAKGIEPIWSQVCSLPHNEMLSWRAWMGDTHNREIESSGKGEAIAERNKDEVRLKETMGLREVSWKYQEVETTGDHRCWDAGAGSVLEEQVVFLSSQALESEYHGCP